MKNTLKCIIFALVSVALGIGLGIGLLRWWVITHLDLSHLASTGQIRPSEVAGVVDSLAQKAKDGKLPLIGVDFSTVGFPIQEARLLELQQMIQVYSIEFGNPPEDSTELIRLYSIENNSAELKRNAQKDARECQFFHSPEKSYLLNCDGWSPTNAENLNQLLDRIDKETQKFYAVGGHVLLYFPSRTSQQINGPIR